MIVDNGKYYIYRHIRLDTNQPFYIGIGTKPIPLYKSNEYCRAYSINRNSLWNKIVAKTDYEVEILLETNNYEFLLKKEMEFIALYGRIDTKTGTLSNFTDGGEGVKGYIISLETRKKIGENGRNKGKFGKDNDLSKKVYQYDLEGNFIKEWDSLHCVGRFFNSKELPSSCLSGLSKSYKGYQWFYEYQGEKVNAHFKDMSNHKKLLSKKIFQYDYKGRFVKEWYSLMDIKRELGIPTARISEACKKSHHYYKGNFWFYMFQGEQLDIIPKVSFCRRKILKFTKDDIFIEKFSSMEEALNSVNKGKKYRSQISASCYSNRSAFGYKWKYSNDPS